MRASIPFLGSSGQDPAYASKSEAVHNTVKTVNGSFQILIYFNNLKSKWQESKCFADKTKVYASPSYAPHSNRRTFGSEGVNNGGEKYFGLILDYTENKRCGNKWQNKVIQKGLDMPFPDGKGFRRG